MKRGNASCPTLNEDEWGANQARSGLLTDGLQTFNLSLANNSYRRSGYGRMQKLLGMFF